MVALHTQLASRNRGTEQEVISTRIKSMNSFGFLSAKMLWFSTQWCWHCDCVNSITFRCESLMVHAGVEVLIKLNRPQTSGAVKTIGWQKCTDSVMFFLPWDQSTGLGPCVWCFQSYQWLLSAHPALWAPQPLPSVPTTSSYRNQRANTYIIISMAGKVGLCDVQQVKQQRWDEDLGENSYFPKKKWIQCLDLIYPFPIGGSFPGGPWPFHCYREKLRELGTCP